MSKTEDNLRDILLHLHLYGHSRGADGKQPSIFRVNQAIEKIEALYIKRSEVEAALQHREWDTSEPYDNPDMAQGHNEATDDIRDKLNIKEQEKRL